MMLYKRKKKHLIYLIMIYMMKSFDRIRNNAMDANTTKWM